MSRIKIALKGLRKNKEVFTTATPSNTSIATPSKSSSIPT